MNKCFCYLLLVIIHRWHWGNKATGVRLSAMKGAGHCPYFYNRPTNGSTTCVHICSTLYRPASPRAYGCFPLDSLLSFFHLNSMMPLLTEASTSLKSVMTRKISGSRYVFLVLFPLRIMTFTVCYWRVRVFSFYTISPIKWIHKYKHHTHLSPLTKSVKFLNYQEQQWIISVSKRNCQSRRTF